ncbi:diguanylate cyclase [Halieaceae bacterium IMCC14734]|uniref:Diguanylate cyclase n=1 Tax=Candidatus Litorirhabdus singularis TaxID=2518993 RepID=A0ABT3THH0_9GAMM|nr:VOC family protein [Candidatus Litorirhabdus singularis]MCX2981181.1 diguanylate cyclase [Candidatus Litorirhabdus singularis]
MQLDHMNISVPAPLLDTIRDFYCDVLGLSKGPRPEFGIAGYWLYGTDASRAIVHIIESDNHTFSDMNHLDHVAFQTDDLGAVRAKLEARAIPYGHLDLPDFKLEQVQFMDPVGIKIEINSYPAD